MWVFTNLSSHSQFLLWISFNSPVFEHGCETRCLMQEACLLWRYRRCDYKVWDWFPLYGQTVPMESASFGWFFPVAVCEWENVCSNSLWLFLFVFFFLRRLQDVGNQHLLFHFSPVFSPHCLHYKCRWKTFSFDLPFLYYFSSSQGCFVDDLVIIFYSSLGSNT